MAGLSVAAVALPVGLAYAAMMGVPPVAGLWAAIAGMLGYAVFGSSRTLIVGPDTATCTLIAATLTGMALTDPQDRLVAATGIALTVGVGCLIARVLRLGVLANLLSRPVLIGYMAGVAITLALSQLSGLTGVGLRNSGDPSLPGTVAPPAGNPHPDAGAGAGFLPAADRRQALAAQLARSHPAGGGRLRGVLGLRFSRHGHCRGGRGAGRPAGAQPAGAPGRRG